SANNNVATCCLRKRHAPVGSACFVFEYEVGKFAAPVGVYPEPHAHGHEGVRKNCAVANAEICNGRLNKVNYLSAGRTGTRDTGDFATDRHKAVQKPPAGLAGNLEACKNNKKQEAKQRGLR